MLCTVQAVVLCSLFHPCVHVRFKGQYVHTFTDRSVSSEGVEVVLCAFFIDLYLTLLSFDETRRVLEQGRDC